jgi:hypothetical protein
MALGRVVAAVLAVAVVLSTGWYLTCPYRGGLYLPRLEASQLVVHEGAALLPVLWVPRLPWEAERGFDTLSLALEDGILLTVGGAPPSFGGRYSLTRARTGHQAVFFYPGSAPGTAGGAARGLPYTQVKVDTVQAEGKGAEAVVRPEGLYVVIPSAPLDDGRAIVFAVNMTFALDDDRLVFLISVHDPEAEVLLLDLVLPPQASPLSVRYELGPVEALTYPHLLAPGHSTVITSLTSERYRGSVVITPLVALSVNGRDLWFCPFSASFFFPGASLRSRFDLRDRDHLN